MTSVLVTGKDSQLAQCIDKITPQYPNFNFIFKSSIDLDITNISEVNTLFTDLKGIDYCINCAAYTAVDNAEVEIEKAYNVNYKGVKNLAEACLKNQVKLVHISTDFLFDGTASKPYSENNVVNPINVYGKTKLKGEQAIENFLNDYFIIRTSWLYSEYGHNFLKTMLNLSAKRKELSIVNDQIGSPTYAGNLAEVILTLIGNEKVSSGIYHYSNSGIASWYDFAHEILKLNASGIKLNKIRTKDYPTLAIRPKYSVLDTTKIKNMLEIKIPNWKHSLAIAFKNLNSN